MDRYLITYAVDDMRPTNYAALLSIVLALPPSLSLSRKFTNRERNAIRKAHLFRKKIIKQYGKKNLHKRPDKRP